MLAHGRKVITRPVERGVLPQSAGGGAGLGAEVAIDGAAAIEAGAGIDGLARGRCRT